MGGWTQVCWRVIGEVDKSLPDGTSFADRKKALRAAYPFYERKLWPYKAWLKCQKKYLARFHDARSVAAPLTPLEKLISNKQEPMS